jgi:hypothetical protein
MEISTYNFSSIGSLDAAMKNLQPCCHDSRAATRSKCHCVPFLDFAVGRRVGEMRPSSESPITSRFKQGLGSYGISVGSFRTLYSNCALLENCLVRPHISIPELPHRICINLVFAGLRQKFKPLLFRSVPDRCGPHFTRRFDRIFYTTL